MQLPTLNSNSTAADELYRQYAEILEDLRDARKKVITLGPNGRDYPSFPAYIQAAKENAKRAHTLDLLIQEYEKFIEHVSYYMQIEPTDETNKAKR